MGAASMLLATDSLSRSAHLVSGHTPQIDVVVDGDSFRDTWLTSPAHASYGNLVDFVVSMPSSPRPPPAATSISTTHRAPKAPMTAKVGRPAPEPFLDSANLEDSAGAFGAFGTPLLAALPPLPPPLQSLPPPLVSDLISADSSFANDDC
jgi:hypothetical protein